ncbi:putative membrane protein [Brucella sp. 10RB9215]|nr:putative membrane protein [Brucella abortus]AIJ66455.1 putative membrane protein [Brucella suis]AIJ69886.1 putative membrane protein [Brucella suis bv. 3 str. 686]AIJ72372.1 putative membrane protein [Brucella pinnipedialis]AIJ83568.1 putative membrane protein [Brucella canis]AIJ88225.1 putative membrane protein [Brucella melitensis bv. 1 str. 16M]AIJ94805.1 putative membrane protein [Brucella melitensis bv. 2 str. 63/9]ALM36367.1 hypothetical protein BME20236_II0875 [Brucella melitensis]
MKTLNLFIIGFGFTALVITCIFAMGGAIL